MLEPQLLLSGGWRGFMCPKSTIVKTQECDRRLFQVVKAKPLRSGGLEDTENLSS
jgi:hypothetical protein